MDLRKYLARLKAPLFALGVTLAAYGCEADTEEIPKPQPEFQWPVELEHYATESPLVTEENEIIVTSNSIEGLGIVKVLDIYGNEKKTLNLKNHASPASGDLDGDGTEEIIITDWKSVVALDNKYTELWNYKVGNIVQSTPTIADIDDNGKAEVIFGSNDGILNVLDYEGKVKQGWKNLRIGSEFIVGSAAVGDLDNDGRKEIVIGEHDGYVYAFDNDGTIKDGWPVSLEGAVYASPILVDLNNDGLLETIVGGGGYLNVLTHDGYDYFMPAEVGGLVATAAVADIDNDNEPEIMIIVGSLFESLVHAFNPDGSYAEGWPLNISDGWPLDIGDEWVFTQPLVADLDGDNNPEIVIVARQGYDDRGNNSIYIVKGDTTLLEGWPKTARGYITNTPVIADLGFGGLDLIVSSMGNKDSPNAIVYRWNFPDAKEIVWGSHQGSNSHEGVLKR